MLIKAGSGLSICRFSFGIRASTEMEICICNSMVLWYLGLIAQVMQTLD